MGIIDKIVESYVGIIKRGHFVLAIFDTDKMCFENMVKERSVLQMVFGKFLELKGLGK